MTASTNPLNSKNESSKEDHIEDPAEESASTLPMTEILQKAPILKQPIRLLLSALLIGWTFNFLFWDQAVGLNFALFLIIGLIGGSIMLITEEYRPATSSLWLLIPFLFFAAVTFIRQESLTVVMAFLFSIVTVGLFTTSYLGGRWILYRLSDYVYKFLLLAGDVLFRPIQLFNQVQAISARSGTEGPIFPIAGVMRGLVIAVPVVFCFGSLLASADVVFNQKLDDLFESEKIAEYILQLVLILVSAYAFIGIVLHSAMSSRDEKISNEGQAVIKPFLGFAEAMVVLGSVALLFLAFVVIQFQYFFGGQTNIGVQGFTYSQYARRGFNELVVVAFFSLVLILGLSTLTKRVYDNQKKIYSGLSIAVVGLVMVILVSAYQRLTLAIDWHGFSRLRLYPRVFLIWLGILFIIVALLELYHRERYFAFAAILASMGFAFSLTLVNVDAAIVRHNIPRVLQGKNLNVAHLASLSVDAVPALMNEFYSDKYDQETHEGIGAAITCYLHRDSSEAERNDWRSFNLSRWRAHNALQEVENDLQEYGVNTQQPRDVKVRTPGNDWYRCEYFETARED
jgi:hypothetical protein